jgi:hypothetical protein
MRKPERLLLPAILLLAFCGCSDSKEDSVLGATCTSAAQCRFICETPSPQFPGGFCTEHCNGDSECPHGSLCMTDAGGVCLFPCGANIDCEFLGDGWTCKNKDRVANGKALVCIGD